MKITLELNRRHLLRGLLAIIFLWAALSKLANPQDFFSHLVAYQLPLPAGLLRLTAVVLPWLELCCGLALLSGVWLRAALAWTVLLCGVFVLATGQAWGRGLEISCGCLNLDWLGLGGDPKGAGVHWLQSPGFAFVRASLLGIVAVYLFRGPVRTENPATD